jgi:hypothetical protein
MFRVTITAGLILASIWMFAEGNEFSGPVHEIPDWLVGIPPWVLGVLGLVGAVVAALVPAETVEELVERLLSRRTGGDD